MDNAVAENLDFINEVEDSQLEHSNNGKESRLNNRNELVDDSLVDNSVEDILAPLVIISSFSRNLNRIDTINDLFHRINSF